MTALNPTLPDSSGLFAKSTTESTVLAKLHQASAKALRNYNQNIKWLMDQVNQGHLDKEQITELTLKAMQSRGTHKSPLELAIAPCYSDPKFVSLIEKTDMQQLPTHNLHMIGMALTFGKLAIHADFPPICHGDNHQEESALSQPAMVVNA